VFGISRQALYQEKSRALKREEELDRIKPLIVEKRMKMPRLGTRKLYHLLSGQFNTLGVKMGRDALFSYLREEKMLIKPLKSYTKTTDSKHWLKKYPNLLKELVPSRIEEVFVSDITYVKTQERTHYLSLVTDVFSRKIMGYQLSDDMSAENVAKALQMAIKNRKTDWPLIHHSDRGLQYCSGLYQSQLKQAGIQPSMTDGYDCYQNALAERINGILKQEFLIETCNNRKELHQLIHESIYIFNHERPHLSLNMKTPNQVHEKAEKEVLPRLILLS
jgi:transposase InsO family protein